MSTIDLSKSKCENWAIAIQETFMMRILSTMTAVMITILILYVPPASAQIIGNATVIDGDTIEIRNIRVRLFGIDAPEKRQTCQTTKNKSYPCGQRSKNYLRRLIGNRTVRCDDLGQAKFGRRWGQCFSNNLNLQSAMVRTGHARAYRVHSNDYLVEQKHAQTNEAGIWQGFHVRPGRYRKCWRKGRSPHDCSHQ